MTKWPTTKSNNPVTILRTVAKAIEQEPKRYAQWTWMRRGHELPEEQQPSCGTIACVAGWTCLVTGSKTDGDRTGAKAARILRLNPDQRAELFSAYALDYLDPDNATRSGTKAYARLGLKHIDRFMRKHFGVPLKPRKAIQR